MSGPTLAELRAGGQPSAVIDRLNDEHWAGRLYMRRFSPWATWVFARLGWSPNAVAAAIVVVPLLVLLGTAAFSGFALLLAGTLRAEATLAAANLIYVVMLGVGGVVFPLTKFPPGVRSLLELLPTGALSTGLRDVLANGAAFPAKNIVTLAVWAVVGIALAARFFRWE